MTFFSFLVLSHSQPLVQVWQVYLWLRWLRLEEVFRINASQNTVPVCVCVLFVEVLHDWNSQIMGTCHPYGINSPHNVAYYPFLKVSKLGAGVCGPSRTVITTTNHFIWTRWWKSSSSCFQSVHVPVFSWLSFDERDDGRGWDVSVAYFQSVACSCFSRITNPSFKVRTCFKV